MLYVGHYKIGRYMAKNRSANTTNATRTTRNSSPLPLWAVLPPLIHIFLRLRLRPSSSRLEVLLYSRYGCPTSLCSLHSLQLLGDAVVVLYPKFLYCFVFTDIGFLVPTRLGLPSLGSCRGQLSREMIDDPFLLMSLFLYLGPFWVW